MQLGGQFIIKYASLSLLIVPTLSVTCGTRVSSCQHSSAAKHRGEASHVLRPTGMILSLSGFFAVYSIPVMHCSLQIFFKYVRKNTECFLPVSQKKISHRFFLFAQLKFSIPKFRNCQVLVLNLCVNFSGVDDCDTTDCGPQGFSVSGILQARILQWVALPFSRGSSQLRNQTQVSWIGGRFFTIWATREAF